jgi:heme-degrading monooxygenase HmoA
MENCFAVIFYNKLKGPPERYAKISEEMLALAKKQRGYLGVESVRDPEGIGITVSYWDSMENIKNWKSNADHMAAQAYGIREGYEWYHLTVAKIQYDRSHNIT